MKMFYSTENTIFNNLNGCQYDLLKDDFDPFVVSVANRYYYSVYQKTLLKLLCKSKAFQLDKDSFEVSNFGFLEAAPMCSLQFGNDYTVFSRFSVTSIENENDLITATNTVISGGLTIDHTQKSVDNTLKQVGIVVGIVLALALIIALLYAFGKDIIKTCFKHKESIAKNKDKDEDEEESIEEDTKDENKDSEVKKDCSVESNVNEKKSKWNSLKNRE